MLDTGVEIQIVGDKLQSLQDNFLISASEGDNGLPGTDLVNINENKNRRIKVFHHESN